MNKQQAIAEVMHLFAEYGIECDRSTAEKLVDLGALAKISALARGAAK